MTRRRPLHRGPALPALDPDPADETLTVIRPPVAQRATLDRVTTTITQRELRNASGDIMRRLDAGETFIVTRAGKPVGELSPLRRQRFVSADTVTALFHRAPAIEAARLRADLDAVADAGIDPRA